MADQTSEMRPLDRITTFFKQPKHVYAAVTVVFLIAIVIGAAVLFSRNESRSFNLVRKSSAPIFEFVSDAVPASGPIMVTIPEDIELPNDISKAISFAPNVRGKWTTGEAAREFMFTPNHSLTVGQYYDIRFKQGGVEGHKLFLIVADPAIDAVFPANGSEITPDDQLTIMFNRPMVALSTRDELDASGVPVRIEPDVDGKFSWIGSRTLQFTPTDRWQRSTEYRVIIEEGFTSIEGLSIDPLKEEHTFVVQPLRTVNHGFRSVTQPFVITFNQAVDLEATKAFIHLYKHLDEEGARTQKEIDVIAEYGSDDQTVVHIYPATDELGRAKRWDFSADYVFKLVDAVPSEGDIHLEQPITANFEVDTVVSNVRALSERSNHATLELFDPTGFLQISFTEPVDINRSVIQAPGLATIEYDNPDSKRLINVRFNPAQITKGQSFDLVMKTVMHAEGFVINRSDISYTIRAFPELKITKFELDAQEPLQRALICSSTPLHVQDRESFFDAVLSTNEPVFFREWSLTARSSDEQEYGCNEGEYRTNIRWGLQPLTAYNLSLAVQDDFEQTGTAVWNGTTKDISSRNQNLRSMQDFYTTTVPSRTKLTYVGENYRQIEVAICKMKAETMAMLLDSFEREVKPRQCEQIVHETIDMPDLFWANTFLQVDLSKHFTDTRGHYAIMLGEKDSSNFGVRIDQTGFVTVSDLVATEKRISWDYDDQPEYTEEQIKNTDIPGNLYWVVRAGSLDPVTGAKVTTYNHIRDNNSSRLDKQHAVITNREGVAIVPPARHTNVAIIETPGDSTIITSRDILQWGGSAQTDNRGYIYTDRPLYRPGHEVFFRGIVRQQFDAVYSIVPNLETLDVNIYDSRGNSIFKEDIPVNEFGTFAGSLTLPDDVPLGTYRIQTAYGSGTFDVEEFVGAPFKATVSTDREEYISGESVDITFGAEYFFGAPVPDVDVNYTITVQDYYFDKFEQNAYRFGGSRDYYCYDYDCGYGDQQIDRQQILIESGETTIAQRVDLTSLFEDEDQDITSKIFVVRATMKNANGRSVSTQHSFIVHRSSTYVGLKVSDYFVAPQQAITLDVVTTNTEGDTRAGSVVELVTEKHEWQQFKRQAVDGRFYEQWEEVITPVGSSVVTTDSSGRGSAVVSIPSAGEYYIKAIVRDVAGRVQTTQQRIYVYGNDTTSLRQYTDHTLEVEAVDPSVSAGDTAEIIIKSPFDEGKVLVTVERGRIFSYDIFDIPGNIIRHPVSITEDHIPNVAVSAIVLSANPEVRSGRVFLDVNKEEFGLNVQVTTNKEIYLPGERVTADIRVTDVNGNPVRGELSLAAVDMSVLALKGNPKKNPLEFFFRKLPYSVQTSNTAMHMLEQIDISENTGRKSGDGGTAADLARKKRGVFKQTAFWQADIVTNQQGVAQVTFTLPDNLTTWQLEAVAVTKDTKVGAGYHDFLGRKDVLIQPLTPRFLLPEDKVALGIVVTNQTEQLQSLSVFVDSETLAIDKVETSTSITLEPKSERTFYFDVEIPDNELTEHTIEFGAIGSAFEDVVELALPVNDRDIYEATALSSFTQADAENEYIYIPDTVVDGKGELSVRANATLAIYVADAFEHLISFPYGCSEQIMSRIGALATVSRAFGIKNMDDQGILDNIKELDRTYSVEEAIADGLDRVYQNQNSDGGVAYFSSSSSNYYLTLYVLETMQKVKRAGFAVDTEAMERMAAYVGQNLSERIKETPVSLDQVINGARVLSTLENRPPNYRSIVRTINRKADRQYVNERASTLTLNNLAFLGASNTISRSVTTRVLQALENRIAIDARGAYVQTGDSRLYEAYETDIKNTALYLQNITLHNIDTPIQDELLRWILANRTSRGWGTTQNNLVVLDALADFIEWSGENEASYDALLLMDGVEQKAWSVNSETFQDQVVWSTDLDELPRNKNIQIGFTKKDKNRKDNTLYYDMLLEYALPIDQLSARDEGVYINRELTLVGDSETPVTEARVGDVLRGEITVIIPHDRQTFAIEDRIPAGFELVNFDFATEDQELITGESRWVHGGWRDLRPDYEELRDDRIFAFREFLPAGTYTYTYYLRATTPGEFQHLPARGFDFYFPENFGRTKGAVFTVREK